MRSLISTLAALALLPTPALLAADRDFDPQHTLTILEGKVERAALRDQCYLYAELVQTMTEIASHQLLAGEPGDAAATLASVEHYAGLLDAGLARDTKKVKDAEILMRQTAFKLKESLNGAAAEDRPAVEHAIHQLDQVEAKMMQQIFEH